MNVLFDETTAPPLRHVIGRLFTAASYADVAVGHIRLAALDMMPGELERIIRCRVLLDRLDAGTFSRMAGPPQPRTRLRDLYRFVSSERVEVRSAGMGSWAPDFSLYRGISGADGRAPDACLIGAHYFRQPVAAGGPSFTCLLTDPAAVARALRRFERLWEHAHDVRPAVLSTIERLDRYA